MNIYTVKNIHSDIKRKVDDLEESIKTLPKRDRVDYNDNNDYIIMKEFSDISNLAHAGSLVAKSNTRTK